MSINRDNYHMFDRFSFSYCKITRNKLAINIVNWYNVISADIIKFFLPKFDITTAIIINSVIEFCLLILY